ncbi:hypothetical protein Q6A84_01590 [Aliarcobacter skirrowii]|uniref:outer membrane protein n=1 Tax=Aliarcobacter skirrowii TaxID=28200 RepID=UPI0029B87C07|nr:hypothetical protein [Aliarcobacter skirrowii]MDX4062879.1 hypothetical protein [Aliarcobacter skirrowii]
MKKLLLFGALSSIILTNSMADTKTYLGLQYGVAVTQFQIKDNSGGKEKFSDNANAYKILVGQGLGDNNYLQLYYELAKYDDVAKQKEFGLEWIKKEKVVNNLYPFAKLGLGIANMDLESDVSALSLTLGAGVDLKTTDDLSFYIGIDYNYKKWEKFEDITSTYKTTQNSIKPYIGLNLKF